MRETVLFLLLISLEIGFTSSAPRNPLKDPRKCGRPECEQENDKFGFKDNIRYRYKYSMHLKSEFFGSGDNTSDLYLDASILLTFPKPCEGVLNIQSVELRDKQEQTSVIVEQNFDYYGEYDEVQDPNLHPKSGQLAEDVQRFDLRFAFHDGAISEVCPNPEEPIWVLNFKKGIVSSLQNSMIRFDVDRSTSETDISGTCSVNYSLEGSEKTSILIRKEKQLETCTQRYQTHSFLQTTPYNFKENRAIWPIINSLSYCNLTVDHNIYKEISCFERHLLIPFSNNQTGAVTETSSKLILTYEEKVDTEFSYSDFGDDNYIHKRSPLLFDHTPSQKPTHGEIKASRDLLKQMCKVGFPDIQRGFIEVFTKFLKTARLLTYTALHQLLARASSICTHGKQHVLESLPFIASGASVQIMRDQLIGEAVSISVARNWMTALSFLQRPTEEMLQTFYALIEYGKLKNNPDYTLGPSAAVHTFCRHNPNCGQFEEVRNIVKLLEEEFLQKITLNTNKRAVKERLIIVLKGLGNIGVMNENFLDRLKDIIQNEIINIEVRLQATLAFRRTDCLQHRDSFLNIYKNFTENSEIRTLSYVQAMRCPDFFSIHTIKEVLRTEEINQVGSYVWSHLTNLIKSSSPVRVEAQGLLVDSELSTKYKLDIRKFSRNYEHSIFLDEYNFGTATDANLIFGTDSYIPRIASVNFTADLFGESVNFFEISARAQGFEQLIASIFGPKGPLSGKVLKKKFSFLNSILGDDSGEQSGFEDIFNPNTIRLRRGDEDKDTSYVDEDDSENAERQKRAAGDSREELESKVDQLRYKLKYNYNEPRIAIGLKVFGNDLHYYSMDGMGEVLDAAQALNPINQIGQILSGEEITYTKSGVFLDASYDVPLSIGLPLSIHALGASSVDLRAWGKLNTDERNNKAWNFDIEGKLKPSISADILTTMQSDFFYAVSGIRVKTNLYSSSSVEAKLKVQGAQLVSFQFSLPQNHSEIFSAKSELLVITETEDITQMGIAKRNSNSTCTWPIIDRAVGLKICTKYSLPDMSKSFSEHPSLLLTGPIELDISLEKADPTAKVFLFEYRATESTNSAEKLFRFETPGSTIPRLLLANFTRVPEFTNISMSFQNGENSHSAFGTYMDNPDDRRLEFYLDSDGRKNLALEMKLNRTAIKNGYMYYPIFSLSVNDARIAGLSGSIKVTSKNGATQHDIDILFETKKLQLRVDGYLVETEIAYSAKLKTDYRFEVKEVESVHFEGEVANRSEKTKTEYKAKARLISTAYRRLNFASNATWLSVLGHSEGVITYNNAEDLINPHFTTTARVALIRTHSDDIKSEGPSTTAFIETIRPSANIDFRFLIKHEERFKNGPLHNIVTALRYAPKRETTALLSVYFPRRNHFALDTNLNITVPGFNSTTARFVLFEKEPGDYLIDFAGSWFSGISLKCKGTYLDRSTRTKSNHHLKLSVQSSLFKDSLLNLIYLRDVREVQFKILIDYDSSPYRLLLTHVTQEDAEAVSYAEVQVQDKHYWISAKLTSHQPKSLIVEIHVDKIRDIQLNLRALSNSLKKEISLELKWDANRDPSQRLAFLAELNQSAQKQYDGTLMLTYPERTFSSNFEFVKIGPDHRGTVQASWSPNDVITLVYSLGWILEGQQDIWLNSELRTPFDGWAYNSFNTGLYYKGNLLLTNASLLWAEQQKIGFALKGDYEISDQVFGCDLKLSVNSTIQDVPTGNAHIKHWQDLGKVDTDLDFRYKLVNESLQAYSWHSVWNLKRDELFKNISGTVTIHSPFDGYRTGGMITKLSFGEKRTIQCAATIKLEERKFTVAVDGHVKKLTENMLQINITTPIERFKTINGKLGLSEKDKYAVAQVEAPAGELGIEIKLFVLSLTNFDVLFRLATPVESLQKIYFVGKMKIETIDLRGGLNSLNIGFTGVWRMRNLTDFEYSYQVFTPLENYEKNGIVIKFIKSDEFDLIVHAKFAKYKIGLKSNARPKPKLLSQLRNKELELDFLQEDNFEAAHNEEEDPDYEEDESDYDYLINYIAYVELDTVIWPTIIGNGEVEEIGDYYLTVGKIKVPQGDIDIKDRLYYPDYLNIKNYLKIQTPFQVASEIKSKFEYSIDFRKHYLGGLEFSMSDNKLTTTKHLGFFGNYTVTKDDADLKTHDLAVILKTPINSLEQIAFTGSLEMEESSYGVNVTLETRDTKVSVGGALESDENYLNASVGLSLETPFIPDYACRIYFMKDFSEVENSVDLGFIVRDNGTDNKLSLEAKWHVDRTDYINAKCRLHTNLLPLKLAESSILITRAPNPVASIDVLLHGPENNRTEFHVRGSRKNNAVEVEIFTPIRDYSNITIVGTLSQSQTNDVLSVVGKGYRNSAEYSMDGTVVFDYDMPVQASLRFIPKTGGSNAAVQYTLTDTPGKYGKTFQMSANEGKHFCKIGGGYSVRSKLDWDFATLLQSSEQEVSKIDLNAKVMPKPNGHFHGSVTIETPWKHLEIESVKLGANLHIQPESGEVEGEYGLANVEGKSHCSWSWVLLENMQIYIESALRKRSADPRVLQANVRYLNPNKNFLNLETGGRLDVDSKWILDANGMLKYASANEFAVNISAALPEPFGDSHLLSMKYRGNLKGNEPLDLSVETKYEAKEAGTRVISLSNYRNTQDLQGLVRVEWGPEQSVQILEGNLEMLRKDATRKEFTVRVATPFHMEDSVVLLGNYDMTGAYHLVGCALNYPASRKVLDTNVNFSRLSNMNGFLNMSTPFINVSWVKADFNFTTTGGETYRFIEGSWPGDSVYFDLKSKYTSQNLNRDLQGKIKMEMPLTTRHSMEINYDLNERPLLTSGNSKIFYNGRDVLNGKYTCKSEQRAGLEEDVVDISLENKFKPLGIHYTHSRQYTQADYPDFDVKHVQVYELGNSKRFNITGEMHVRSSDTGQEYKIFAIHPNRTVILSSHYDYRDTVSKQFTKIELSPTAWFGYSIELRNITEDDKREFLANVFYPKRNLSTEGWYSVTGNELDSDITIKWSKSSQHESAFGNYENQQPQTQMMQIGLLWRDMPVSQNEIEKQIAAITIKHPSFSKDITINGSYYRSKEDIWKTDIVVDYSGQPEHLLTLGANIRDESSLVGYRNYSYKIYGHHGVSEFDLNVNGSVAARRKFYKTQSFARYERGYLPAQNGLLLGLLDIHNKLVHYHRVSPFKNSRFSTQLYGSFPLYGFNSTLWETPDLNSTGYFFINFADKYTRMEFNMTEDASHNLQMIGIIPDARSAYFDIWRNYEEIRIIDIAYYLRMNHSRLVTSQLHWRPKIKTEIKNQFRSLAASFYEAFSEGLDFWIKTVYSETLETSNDVWRNAKPYTQQFLDDVGGLSVLEDDLEHFKRFVNESYESNDFYIKTVVNFTISVIDELAIRDHIESLPKIFSEIWQVMGDSGKALRKSILWLIETLKTTYNKTMDMISKFLHGESFDNISGLMESALKKYDKAIKDLHISLIKYMENMWNKLAGSVSNYWKSMLHKIEPHVLRFLHYIETALWSLSREIFDFIYERTNEIAESPYFSQVSGLTQDLDLIYKDITSHDTFTNVKKYGSLAWNFMREKYFKLVPFGKEWNDVLTEIWEEMRKLQEISAVKTILQKIDEIQAKLEWLAEELQIEKRLHQLWEMGKRKLLSSAQTALETDDKYREAKTKFIFDPDVGLLELEQKLPMSWHAFNDTPLFEEVPEYKRIVEVQNFFASTNFTVWNYIYDLKSILDPKTWLPPYKANALMIGSRHYMTFDKRFVDLQFKHENLNRYNQDNKCSYLLAQDFYNKNFSLISEPSVLRKNNNFISTRKYTLMSEKHLIEIDVAGDTIRIGRNATVALPVTIGDITISRDADVLKIESDKDFAINCNFQFDLCWFELGGWYFGQTAGLLGTMNNEPFDDITKNNGRVAFSSDDFINSWELYGCEKSAQKAEQTVVSSEVAETCTEFFKSGYFSSCNSIIDPIPFYNMCLDLGAHSLRTVVKDDHPAQKGACTAALAYIEACAALRVPLRVPDKCVHCDIQNGGYVPEGQFIEIKNDQVPRTTDVVFIVEAKPCNQDLTYSKSLVTLVNMLNNELVNANLTNNRYAVVAFGGRAPFDKPRNVVYNNQVFSDANNLKHYFDHIQTFNGSNKDIFQALSVASKLIFRAGASKTFILLPCSECLGTDMKFDYSSLLQLMLEEGINLHVLMDKDFEFDKTRLSRIFFGMDRDLGYSKRDLKIFTGDATLRKQVRLPKQGLGLCAPLAMETNGSVFTATKLHPGRNPIKKFGEIFSKRIAKTAVPSQCQMCECTGHNTGVAFMTCTSCNVPNFDSIEDTGDDFNWDWDWDEEDENENLR